ncbi:MAG: zinc-dependent alcohol dehydrogenase [Mycobacterium sp.]
MRSTADGIRVVEDIEHAEGGVRVSVASSGICGSDLHMASFGPSPVTLGHECSGRLDDGTPVAVLPFLACGHCDRCAAGDPQQCGSALQAMCGVTVDGGLADEVWVDPRCARVVPLDVPIEHACLVEPIAVALHGINRAGVLPGAKVLVIGAGPIGLCTVAAARYLGAGVDLLARHSQRMEAGERLGAGTSVFADYDFVLDAAGTQGSMDSAVAKVRPGGTIGILGSFWDPVTIGLAFQMKEVTLVPSFSYGHHHGASEFDKAIRVLADAPDFPPVLITHHFALDDAAEDLPGGRRQEHRRHQGRRPPMSLPRASPGSAQVQ